MAILQALFALISKSAGKILNAIFGWAVRALFGQTSSRQQTFLSALVGAAVAWPVLAFGLIAPKTAALLLAFVPIPHWIPGWAVRLVWLALAVLIPFALGLAVAAKGSASARQESFMVRLLRGFPITLGLAAAFLIMFVSVPVMRFVALVRRQKSADIPLATDGDAYHQVARTLCAVLGRHGFDLRPSAPGWWVSAPTRILTALGGPAFRSYVPDKLEYYRSADLELSLYPSGVLLRGRGQRLTWAHGLIAEAAVRTDGLQTVDPAAQDVERQIHRVWRLYEENPVAHRASPHLLGRVQEMTGDLGRLDVPFDEWQLLYRQLVQLDRELRGTSQLIDRTAPAEAPVTSPAGDATAALPTGQLVSEIVGEVSLLAKKQMELAKIELGSDLRKEIKAAGGLGVAAIGAIVTVALLLVTVVLALATLMPGWAAGLAVSGVMTAAVATTAAVSWRRRVRHPLALTRHEAKEDVRFAKEHIA
jgi:hypothetical protein